MLDINLIRKNPQLIKDNLKKRGALDKVEWVDDLIKRYQESIDLKKQIEDLRHKRNIVSLKINEIIKQGKKATKEILETKNLPKKIQSLEKKQEKLREEVHNYLWNLPNLMHESVPIGKDASENKEIKKWGTVPKFNFPIKNHVELVENLGLADFEASAKTSGNGFYYLKGNLALLNQALISFTIDFMKNKNYVYIEPPLMLNEKFIYASMDKKAIEESVYSVKEENLGLIGTAEQALLAMHASDAIKEEDLPKKYFSYTMCFRREIGAHGINEKGLWRTHQFNKVEQFIFCKPEDSYKYYDELLRNSEEIYQQLKIPYRVLEMCSGDIASWKAKTCDIEAWRPTTNKYEEVGSLTNCTDYQARKLNIKIIRKDGTRDVLHTLNNTAIATSRAMVAILENYQQKDGTINVPLVLQPYCGFKNLK